MRIFLPGIVLAFAFLLLAGGRAIAQSPAAGTVTFSSQVTTNLPVTASIGYATYRSDATSQVTGQGFEFAMTGTAAASLQISDNGSGGGQNLTFSRSATSLNITDVRIRSAATSSTIRDNDALLNTPGGQFDAVSMQFTLINNATTGVVFTFTGYKDGVVQGTQTATSSTTAGTYTTITFSTAFNDVDDIQITGFGTGTGTNAGQTGIRIDNIATTNAIPTFYYNTPQILTAGVAASLSPFQTSNGTFTYTISPTLPSGLSFSTSTGVISGTPTAGTTSAAADYTVTATNSAGSNTSIVNIAVVSTTSAVVDANTATNTMPENSAVGTTVGLTAYTYPANSTTNIAAGKTATATSLENGTFLASYTTDGATTGNRWSSGYYDTQDLTIDLGASYAIGGVNLYWEVALGKDFQIQVSPDNVTYTTIKSIYNNTTFNNVFTNLANGGVSTVGRYVRIHGINRGTQYGYSLYEVQVYQVLTNTYSFTSNPSSLYAIDGTTGVVTVNNAAIDYETATSRSVTIQATDGTTTTSAAFSIAITNVNEAPVITSNSGGATATISVTENTTAVTTVVATDVDASDTRTYSISGADAAKFTITSGGVLTFTSAPNYASLGSAAGTNAYTVIATATDAGGLTDAQTLTVNVTRTSFLSPYAYRIPLTLNTVTAATTYTITSDQTSFPALVRISDPSLVYSSTSCTNKVQYPNGPAYDFAFTTSTSSTELKYQVESYDQVNGVLLVWVQVPSLTYQTNSNLYFYFGSATSTAATHTTAFYQSTWASDYKAVFHFNETTYTGSVTDGTSGGHTGTTTGMTSADLITGKIGTAYSFDGSTKRIASNAVTITGAFTLSAWVYLTSISRDQKVMTNQGAAGGTTGGYKLGVFTDNTIEAESGTAMSRSSSPAAPTFAAGAWHYVQGVYTGSSLFNYVDGQPYKVLATTNNPSATTPLYIGVGEGGNTYYFAGTIDEPRISNIAKTNDWIKFEYANQNSPSTFTTAGSFTTDATNVLTIPGGVIYTYSGGTYTVNVAGVSLSPTNNGKESFVLGSGVTLGAASNLYSLTINSGVTVALNGQTLNCGCNIINNGTIAYNSLNASTLNFNGTMAAQSYTGTSAIYSSVGTLKINNTTSGATLNINGGPLDVYNLITLTAGSINVNSLATLTLKSSATQTAAVDIITSPSTNKITGYVNAERFLTGGASAANRGYRLMSSPVNQTSATVASTNTFGLSYVKNHTYLNVAYLGAFTGGPGGTGSGFSGSSNAPTIYLYKETLPISNTTYLSGKHVGISAITTSGSTTSTTVGTTATVTTTHTTDATVTTSVPIGNGFLFYFVGPSTRTSGSASGTNPTAGPPVDATITANGYLNQGTFTVNLWYTPTGGLGKLSNSAASLPGYNMMGNPYAATINLATVLSDNTASIDGIYMLGTKTGGTSQNYVTYVAGGTSSPTALGYAVSGAGFLVHVKAGVTTGTLTFNEAQKAPTQQITGTALIMSAPRADAITVDGKMGNGASRGIMAMPAQQGPQPITGLYVKMEKDSLVYDYCGIYFRQDYKAIFEDGDARYLTGLTNIISMASLSADGVNTAVNLMPDYHNGSRIKLNVNASTTGLYHVKIEGIRNIDTLYNIFLMDKLKKDSLDMRRYGDYAFNLVKTDTTTFGANRFELSIQRRPIVPFVLAAFAGNKVTGGVKLDWKTYNESNYTGFILEKQNSKTGQFEQIYERQSNGGGNYSFVDPAPNAGNNIYRLKENDIDGKISYSGNVTVFYDKIGINGLFSVFPNPTVEVINVSVPDNQSSATYKMRLYDTAGNLLLQKSSNTSNWTQNVSGLKPGAYIVEVLKSNGASLGKGKFIKN